MPAVFMGRLTAPGGGAGRLRRRSVPPWGPVISGAIEATGAALPFTLRGYLAVPGRPGLSG